MHLYEDHGPGFVEKLRGMFAIALWDGRARRLVLARDRFGIKPLYYRLTAESLSFASELKALLKQPGFSREIDLSALETYLAFSFIPAPPDHLSGGEQAPAGLRLDVGSGSPRRRRSADHVVRTAPSGGLRRRAEGE